MNGRILPLLALVIAIGAFFVYVNPLMSGPIAEAKAAIARDDAALAVAQQYTAQENQLAAARNAIDPAELTKLNELLPDSADNVRLILDLDRIAGDSGLQVSGINVVTGTASGSSGGASIPASSPVSSIDLSLSAVGDYTAFQTFLSSVERSLRLLDVRSISIQGSDTGIYTYQVTLRLYWLH